MTNYELEELQDRISDFEQKLATADGQIRKLSNDLHQMTNAHNIVVKWSRDSMQTLLNRIVELERKCGIPPALDL